MDEDVTWAIVIIAVVGLLVLGLLAHEYMWINQADDYTKCLASCSYTLDSQVTLEELMCVEACEPLSECSSKGVLP